MPLGDNLQPKNSPIGEAVAALCGGESASYGYSLALEKWNFAQGILSSSAVSAAVKLTVAQLHSLKILEEWWQARSQQKSLTYAAINALQAARDRDAERGSAWSGTASRQAARLAESTYHGHMFLLFEFEFVSEAITQSGRVVDELPSILLFLRAKCSKLAALQRIAHAVVCQASAEPSQSSRVSDGGASPLLDLICTAIPATVDPCPWLHGQVDDSLQRPYFLWDVRSKRTVVTSQLPVPPDYICISHTWGRWRKETEPSVQIPGVPWLVPQNSKFEVASLPVSLEQGFKHGYVWFDLLCIPQDGSVLASQEISRQAVIFKNARGAVAWLNDVKEWRSLVNVATWFALFYLHTNVNSQPGELPFPSMPQVEDTDYPDMELYDWSTGNVSSLRVINDAPVDETATIAECVPWFSSLWTLQELCMRPGLLLCNVAWRPLSIGDLAVTMDTLATLEAFVSSKDFATSVTRPQHELPRQSESGLPPLPSRNFADISLPRGCSDLRTLFIDTHVNQVMTVNRAAIFSFGQLRRCTSHRGEAIMSVVGATDWYDSHVQRQREAPPKTDLVLDMYPPGLVREAAEKIGPTFFMSVPTELRHLKDVVDLSTGIWTFHDNPPAIGTMLPFMGPQTPGYFQPPSSPSLTELAHPAVKEWELAQDGSVVVRRAGILRVLGKDLIEAIVYAPLYDENDLIHYDTLVKAVDEVNLGGWLEEFSNPQLAPNFAVSLFQVASLSHDEMAGTHVGLLLKSCGCGASKEQLQLVKVGIFFTKAVDILSVATTEVNWRIL